MARRASGSSSRHGWIDEGTFSPTVGAAKAAAIAWGSSNGIILMFEQELRGSARFDLRIEDLLRTNMELLIRGLQAANPGG